MLNTVTIEQVIAENIPQYDLRTCEITSPDVLFSNLEKSMATSPYAGTVATLSGLCRAAVAATQPLSTTCSSFMATTVPRKSVAARAASVVGSAVKSMLSPQALATIITVAILCGGLGTAGTVEVSGALGLDVIHYCDNDKSLGSFVSTQNPRAQIHT